MLYDNAQMLSVFSELTKNNDKVYKKLIDDIFDFLENNLTGDNGLIFSNISAVTEIKNKIEGDYYVWDKDEIKDILQEDFDLFKEYFNLNQDGLWEKNKYVLKRINDDDFFTKKYNISSKKLKSVISESITKLRKSKEKREKPIIDKKVLTAWNALTAIGMSNAFQSTGEKKFIEKLSIVLQLRKI